MKDSVIEPRVVIVGAGFAGLWAARTLAQTSTRVLLVDRNNYHTFLPLLYQVAAAELSAADIAYPIRCTLRSMPNVAFRQADVREVNWTARVLETSEGAIPYDFMVLALGSVSHFFNIPGAQDHAYPLRTLDHAIALRNHILTCFERASHEADESQRTRLLRFVIAGGGPTGVEFAGALAELINGPLARDYPGLRLSEVQIVLLEARDQLLFGMPTLLQDYAVRHLEWMGVSVRRKTAVARVTPQTVLLHNATVLPTETVVWTAGVRGAPQANAWGLPTTREGRIPVLPTLQVAAHPEVYVAGDLVHLEANDRPLPMVAPVAVQEGIVVAGNILRQMHGDSAAPFCYRNRGTLATIGRNAAVAEVGGHSFTGLTAWLLWVGVHIWHLIGFRNRLIVFINWAWDYFLVDRPVRLIFPSELGGSNDLRGANNANVSPQNMVKSVGG